MISIKWAQISGHIRKPQKLLQNLGKISSQVSTECSMISRVTYNQQEEKQLSRCGSDYR